MCYVPRMALIPLSFSLPRDYPAQAPFLQTNFPRVHLSPPLAFSPSVFSLFANPPPLAPVVARRPSRLTGGRCHAAPSVLVSVPMFGGLPPRPVRLAVLGSGVGGGA